MVDTEFDESIIEECDRHSILQATYRYVIYHSPMAKGSAWRPTFAPAVTGLYLWSVEPSHKKYSVVHTSDTVTLISSIYVIYGAAGTWPRANIVL